MLGVAGKDEPMLPAGTSTATAYSTASPGVHMLSMALAECPPVLLRRAEHPTNNLAPPSPPSPLEAVAFFFLLLQCADMHAPVQTMTSSGRVVPTNGQLVWFVDNDAAADYAAISASL